MPHKLRFSFVNHSDNKKEESTKRVNGMKKIKL